MDGALHLGLAGVASAGDRLLDAVGGEFDELEPVALGDEEDDAAGVAHEDGGAGVGVMGVDLLDGADLRAMFADDFLEFAFELDEALGDGLFAPEADDAAIDEPWAEEMPVDDAVAGEEQAGIDAKDTHGGSIAGWGRTGEARALDRWHWRRGSDEAT